jgi:hypothetical protein
MVIFFIVKEIGPWVIRIGGKLLFDKDFVIVALWVRSGMILQSSKIFFRGKCLTGLKALFSSFLR